MEKKLSAATKRAIERGYFEPGNDWYCTFKYKELTGDICFEEGVVRRDPTSVIFVDGKYYVWYTKSVGDVEGFSVDKPEQKVFKWDYSEVWYATSEDSYDWKEQGCAIHRGEPGSYDDRSVFTPEILAHDGKYYLVYQCVKSPYTYRVKENIAMSIADSPEGPWRKLDAPILTPADNGVWEGEEDNRFLVKEKGDFDSHKVHDPTLHFFNNKFYLYYKGERMGEENYMGGREIRWGVAIADKAEGPYIKSEYNPVSNSGHETCLWEYEGGMAAMITSDGMEKNTLQYAKDGINFEIKGAITRHDHAPHAAGPFRIATEDMKAPLDGIRWGLCMTGDEWDYIMRFEVDENQKIMSNNRAAAESPDKKKV